MAATTRIPTGKLAHTDRSVKIGDVWLREYSSGEETKIRLGIWDQDAETTLTLEELKKMRKFITETIIKTTFKTIK